MTLRSRSTPSSIVNPDCLSAFPRSVIGVALNFQETVAVLRDAFNAPPYGKPPVAPVLYLKTPNTWISDNETIPVPTGVEKLRMAGTLGVLIGRDACNVIENRSLDYVKGFTVVNDVSIPHASSYRPAIRERCSDGFCAISPNVVHHAALPDENNLEIRVSINGEIRCANNTANLVRPIAKLIAGISEFMTLHSGDLLLVGEPDNAPLAVPGDRVRVEIAGVGAIENTLGGAR